MTHARDGTNRLFILEQGGRILVLQPGATAPSVFLDITAKVLSGGERGLLGSTFHPAYATTRRFFVNYTRLRGKVFMPLGRRGPKAAKALLKKAMAREGASHRRRRS